MQKPMGWIAGAALVALLGCSGDDNNSSWGQKPAAANCGSLRTCCDGFPEATRVSCQQAVDSYAKSSNSEQLCKTALDGYTQAGLCSGNSGGSAGKGGNSEAGVGGQTTGGTSGSPGTGGGGNNNGGAGQGGSGGTSQNGGSGGIGGSGGSNQGGSPQGGSGGSSGSCAHDVCSTGDALDSNCSSCVAQVCAADAYCCSTKWNSYCVDGAKKLCGECGGGSGGTGGSGGGGSCSHDVCTTGDALSSSCSSCASTVCASDPYCCSTKWNSYCVDGAKKLCNECK